MNKQSLLSIGMQSFLGQSPDWFKWTVIAFLAINPVIASINPFLAGWLFVLEFIFTLAMALQCYPLQAGGLLAIEAVLIGLTSAEGIYHEAKANFPVILLLVFMVAGIYFMKDLLMFLFTRLLLDIKRKWIVGLLFCFASAFLSAFLDALTVTAVIISVATGFYGIYHRVVSSHTYTEKLQPINEESIQEKQRQELKQFRGFLRSLLMHAVVGTALGGVCTMVGEPQNLLIAERAGWDFIEFFYRMAPVTMPVLLAGLLVCVLLEKTRLFGYGITLPESIREILTCYSQNKAAERTQKQKFSLCVQGVVGFGLILALAFHWAPVGLIGLMVIILITSLTGIVEEHSIGRAFQDALPFTALLMVFFCVVSVIHDQGLFRGFIQAVLETKGSMQISMFYLANGVLSAVSDNVFVATVYINEAQRALELKQITRDQFDLIAVAVNTGTNIPSVATPNGQAAFLFLLTSAVAPLVRLSYGRMVWMALPYTIVMSLVGLFCVYYLLEPATQIAYDADLIPHHQVMSGNTMEFDDNE